MRKRGDTSSRGKTFDFDRVTQVALMQARRLRVRIQGQVQGVGFRPFLYRLAVRHGLTGCVANTPSGVSLEVQGTSEQTSAFLASLERERPVLALITEIEVKGIAVCLGEADFIIKETEKGDGHNVLISPDVALCEDCRKEMEDHQNRRYGYAFTNCTNCGPRYSITFSMPYDRKNTTMGCFSLCEACQNEYLNPQDRRFHAQPNACPVCGPELYFFESSARADSLQVAKVLLKKKESSTTGKSALSKAAHLVIEGRTLALKGLGGFHLVCNALDNNAVQTLRKRKNRPDKPFAIMVPDLETAKNFARITSGEEELLSSVQSPIVLCRLSKKGLAMCKGLISPDTCEVGLMLPYTPLHKAFFSVYKEAGKKNALLALVMTSANRSGDPICITNREACDALCTIADGFLLHSRDILVRVDDSVVRLVDSGLNRRTMFIRRSRGYVPQPLALALPEDKGARFSQPENPLYSVIGVGAELKNTFCLLKGNTAFPSQYIGDMQSLETRAFYQETFRHVTSLLWVKPGLAVHDLHPGYASTSFAKELPVKHLALQHHYAHAYAVLGENQFYGKALAVTLDGTGFGEDGTLWGGEILYLDMDTLEHRRLAHLSSIRLPGGEQAIKEPWRVAHGLLYELGAFTLEKPYPFLWLQEFAESVRILPRMLDRKINCPSSTSAGRLFDAVGALLGLCFQVTYEGQAAIKVEESCRDLRNPADSQGLLKALFGIGLSSFEELCPIMLLGEGCSIVDTHTLFMHLTTLYMKNVSIPIIAALFHEGLAAGVSHATLFAANALGVQHVGLSGGCFQNAYLAARIESRLSAKGITCLQHQLLPPNDGCISFGQAFYGRLWACQNTL